jgi:hypothetical protein
MTKLHIAEQEVERLEQVTQRRAKKAADAKVKLAAAKQRVRKLREAAA